MHDPTLLIIAVLLCVSVILIRVWPSSKDPPVLPGSTLKDLSEQLHPVAVPKVPSMLDLLMEQADELEKEWKVKSAAAVEAHGKPAGDYRIRKIEGTPECFVSGYEERSLQPAVPPTYVVERFAGAACYSPARPGRYRDHYDKQGRSNQEMVDYYEEYNKALMHAPKVTEEWASIRLPQYTTFADAEEALKRYLDPRTQEVYYSKDGNVQGRLS